MSNHRSITVAVALGLLGAASFSAKAHEHESLAATYANRVAELKTWFKPGAIAAGPTLVDCTLSAGTTTMCFSITLKPNPSGYKTGPWCPRNIVDGPDKSGI